MSTNGNPQNDRPYDGNSIMTKQLQWRVIDPTDGGTVFDADSIHNAAPVVGGLYTARDYARKLARDNTDPMAVAPLKAVKDVVQ